MRGADPSILGFSWIFIQMFFIQSGYLITNILVHSKKLSFREYLKKFYWNRILRIFPVYFLYLFILVGIFATLGIAPDFMSRVPYLFTYTYNFTRLFEHIDFHPLYVHLWSLSVEEQFYLIWPFFIYFLNEKQVKIFIVFLLVACPIIRLLLGEYLISYTSFDSMKIGEAIYGFTLSHFDAFAIGGSIALFEFEWLKKNILKVIAIFALIASLVLAWNQYSISGPKLSLEWTSFGIPLANLHNYQHVWSFTLVNILFFLIIIVLINPKYKGLLNNKLLISMGKVVYGTYIFHFLLLIVITRYLADFSFPVLFVLSLGGAYLSGLISYNVFEKRFLKYKY
jgi:peptidoglycan/LPS O-acetylase OafA/YrhL